MCSINSIHKLGHQNICQIHLKTANWPDLDPKKKKKKPTGKEKKIAPPLPSKHRGLNAGKGDCRHYHSHLGRLLYSSGKRPYRGGRVVKGGIWRAPKPLFSKEPCREFSSPSSPLQCSSQIHDAIT